jgi:hypothetical protein
MKLKMKAANLIDALDIVGVVEARSLTAQQNSSAYLFKCEVRGEEPWCSIYSRGSNQVARVEFKLEELDGPGDMFTIPTHHINMWKKVPDDDITFESSTETKTDGSAFVVKASSTSGMKHEHTSYDPRLIATLDKDFEDAKEAAKALPETSYQYYPGILKEALGEASPFLPKGDKKDVAGDHLNTVQIFDESNPEWAKGNGHMFCSDTTRAFYFQAADFESKGFTVHSSHIPKLTEFLGKCSGRVKIYRSEHMAYAVSGKGEVFGWVHQVKTHDRWRYVGLSRDKYVILIPKVTLLNAIDATVESHVDRVKLVYTHNNGAAGGGHTIHFTAAASSNKFESFPVQTFDKEGEPSLEENFEFFVNLDHFKSLFSDAKAQRIELRVTIINKDDSHPKGGALFRTIDEFQMFSNGKLFSISDKPEPGTTSKETAYPCKVTRCMSSMT